MRGERDKTFDEAGGASPSAAAKIDRMGTEGTFKLLLEFSIPAVVGVLVQMLYNVIKSDRSHVVL